MKLSALITAFGRGLLRQACCACIERCGLIAGASGECCAVATEAFLNEQQ